MKTKLRIFNIILIALIAFAAVACSDSKDEPVPVDKAPRTVLVYMVAANSLGIGQNIAGVDYPSADDADVAEMLAAARAGNLDGEVLVFRSRYDETPTLNRLTPSGLVTLKEYDDDIIAVSIAQMRSVFDDMKRLAPAEKYGLVLWSHGSGWLENGYADPDYRPLSFGEDRGKRMNVTSLRQALDGAGFEYLYFDCCYMSTIEVAYQLRDCVDYIVASASELPRDGMPYDRNLPELLKDAPAGLISAATNTFDHYNTQANPEDRTCTIAVLDTHHLGEVAAATRAIYEVTPLPHPGLTVTNYRGRSRQGFSIDFGEYVEALASEAALAGQIAQFTSSLDKTVLYEAATPRLWDDYPIYHHSGLATYVFDTASASETYNYRSLAWYNDVVSAHIR